MLLLTPACPPQLALVVLGQVERMESRAVISSSETFTGALASQGCYPN